jgi:hypothetical protein
MAIHLQGGLPCFAFLTVLIVPGIIVAVMLHSAVWVYVGPIAVVVVLIVLAMWRRKRKVTPQQFADELERHLLGTDGAWDWDNTTSIAIANDRLDRLRTKLSKFDSLTRKKRQDELKDIIAALRRGEVSDVDDE